MGINKLWLRAAATVALSSAAMLATAGTVTLTGWTFDSGNGINVSSPNHIGPAGGFKGSLAGFGAPFDTPSFETYCVELTESFSFGSVPSGYSLLSGSAYTQWGSEANRVAISNRIGQLLTYVNSTAGAVSDASESTSLQLAIWNSIYDTDQTLKGGTFFEKTDGTVRTYADTLLANSLGTTSNLNVYVLTRNGSQDFLVTSAVPEPGTYALMMAGLAGMGFVARRRRRAQA